MLAIMPGAFSRGTAMAMMEEALVWGVCAITAAAVWGAFLGTRHHPPQ